MNTKNKKILYVITKSVWGGAQRYIFDLATRLNKEFEVVVATGGQGPLVEKLSQKGIKTTTIPFLERDINTVKEILALAGLLKIFIKERPDVIHLNSSKIGGLGAIAAWLYKLSTFNFKPRVVFTVHGWPFNEERSGPSRRLILWLIKLAALFQNKIIVINEADLLSGKKYNISPKKLTLIHNGLDLKAINHLRREEARKFLAGCIRKDIAPQTILIGNIAELTKNKGLKYLIESIKILKERIREREFKVIIMGEGEEHEFLAGLIDRYQLHHHVFLTGFMADAERLLSALDIFVFPSIKEGLPYAIMEAMAAQLPIIASDMGGIPDLIRHKQSGLLMEPKNPEKIAQALKDIIEDQSLRSRLANSASLRLETNFSIHDMIQKTKQLYGEA